jgi:hypothetical protein
MFPTLKMTTLPYFQVHYTDLQEFITAIYRSEECDVLEAAGVTNGIIPEFIVSGSIADTPANRSGVYKIRSGQAIRDLRLTLNLLAKQERIPKGRYIIDTKKKEEPIEVYKAYLVKFGSLDHEEVVKCRNHFSADPTFAERAAVVDEVWVARSA